MPNKITVYLGALDTIGVIELEVPGMNDLYPINANMASNAKGHRAAPGEYTLDSIAYTPETPEVQAAYGRAIIRFVGENENKLAIFGGETAPDGGLLPTEGSSVRVDNDVLGRIVGFIKEGGSEAHLTVTDDRPGLINSFRSNKWYGRPAETGRIRHIRPARFRGDAVEHTFYPDSGLDDSGSNDWLMWELLYSLGGAEQIPEAGDEPSDDSEQSEEAPYIADPFGDTEQQNLTFERQNESRDDTEIGPGDTSDIYNAPDNNY